MHKAMTVNATVLGSSGYIRNTLRDKPKTVDPTDYVVGYISCLFPFYEVGSGHIVSAYIHIHMTLD